MLSKVFLLCLLGIAYADIRTTSVDLKLNSLHHHTDKYADSIKELIVRRGDNISVTVEVEGSNVDPIKLLVHSDRDGLIESFILGQSREIDLAKNFSSDISSIAADLDRNTTKLEVKIWIPTKAAIGNTIFTFTQGDEEDSFHKISAFILFNPWCKGDETYMISASERQEYVLNDIGKVYLGSSYWFSGKEWVFGQFHKSVLPAVKLLLQNIPMVNRTILSDPVLLSRAISAGVNANDGFGVLVGNWGSSYFGGTPPGDWASSVDILEQYYTSGGSPVRYGQCWVFAAVTTTVLRSIGIPARPITTFGSAHDTDNSLTIDHFHDANGDELNGPGFGSDSIWNFHAWTEAHMTRPDIHDRAAGGWQVVDATPQELSDGIFQAGPASVIGVKRGEIDSDYDMHFVFSEVQSIDVHWQRDEDSPMGWRRMPGASGDSIADKIVTKALGRLESGTSDAEDVTWSYKFKEPSERRFALMNAAKRAGVEILFHDFVSNDDVMFTLSPVSKTTIGEPLRGFIHMKNNINHTVTVNAKIRVDSTYYNAVKVNRIATVGQVFELEPNAEQMLAFDIPFEEYVTKLVENSLVAVSASAIVLETDQIWVKDTDMALKTPDVMITPVGPVSRHSYTSFKFTFVNTMPIHLTECVLRVHGTRNYETVELNNIVPGEKVEYDINVKIDQVPLVVADLDCSQVFDMTGSVVVKFDD